MDSDEGLTEDQIKEIIAKTNEIRIRNEETEKYIQNQYVWLNNVYPELLKVNEAIVKITEENVKQIEETGEVIKKLNEEDSIGKVVKVTVTELNDDLLLKVIPVMESKVRQCDEELAKQNAEIEKQLTITYNKIQNCPAVQKLIALEKQLSDTEKENCDLRSSIDVLHKKKKYVEEAFTKFQELIVPIIEKNEEFAEDYEKHDRVSVESFIKKCESSVAYLDPKNDQFNDIKGAMQLINMADEYINPSKLEPLIMTDAMRTEVEHLMKAACTIPDDSHRASFSEFVDASVNFQQQDILNVKHFSEIDDNRGQQSSSAKELIDCEPSTSKRSQICEMLSGVAINVPEDGELNIELEEPILSEIEGIQNQNQTLNSSMVDPVEGQTKIQDITYVNKDNQNTQMEIITISDDFDYSNMSNVRKVSPISDSSETFEKEVDNFLVQKDSIIVKSDAEAPKLVVVFDYLDGVSRELGAESQISGNKKYVNVAECTDVNFKFKTTFAPNRDVSEHAVPPKIIKLDGSSEFGDVFRDNNFQPNSKCDENLSNPIQWSNASDSEALIAATDDLSDVSSNFMQTFQHEFGMPQSLNLTEIDCAASDVENPDVDSGSNLSGFGGIQKSTTRSNKNENFFMF